MSRFMLPTFDVASFWTSKAPTQHRKSAPDGDAPASPLPSPPAHANSGEAPSPSRMWLPAAVSDAKAKSEEPSCLSGFWNIQYGV